MQDGTHDNVTATSAQLVTSSKKGTPGVEITFENEHGESLTGTLWLSGAALKRSVESLRHMGWAGDDFSDLATVGLKKCQIVVESDNYGPQLKWVNANGSTGGGGGASVPMDDAAKRRFAAAMKGAVIAASGGKPSTPPARGAGGAPQVSQQRAPSGPPQPPPGYQPEAPTDPDDDLPF